MARRFLSTRVISSYFSTFRHGVSAPKWCGKNSTTGSIPVYGSVNFDGKCSLLISKCYSASAVRELKSSDLTIELTKNSKPKPANDTLLFGQQFSDHMLLAEWTEDEGWATPRIVPYANFDMPPSASCLHYGIELFEGMKAFRGDDGKIRMFRGMENMNRMNNSAYRASLPAFDGEEFLKCIKELVRVDREWVPNDNKCSLYIRPTFIATQAALGVHSSNSALLYCITGPVGPYFKTGTFNPVSLLADPTYVRAWPGGVGDCKMGGNYGPTILAQRSAEEQGCQQVLWLFGEDHQITEVGTMNIFMHWINEDGVEELVTPPLNGIILPGVTRKSLIELGQSWGEFKVSERVFNMNDLIKGLNENRVKELFGAGTACVVCPINRILYKGESIHIPTMENGAKTANRFYNELTGIQYGRIPSDWVDIVEEDDDRMAANTKLR